MEYLVSTASMEGPGVCTKALVEFLTETHNNFIKRCRALLAENDHRFVSHNKSIKSITYLYMYVVLVP